MTKLYSLPKTTSRAKKRVGRGYGSGKGGHTTGRGAKGDLVRGSVPVWFEGGQLPLIRRVPFQRGKNRFGVLKPGPAIVNLKDLNSLPKDSLVNAETLIKAGLVTQRQAREQGVKILGDGEIKLPLRVSLPTSKGAEKKIVKAGGKVGVKA